VDATTVLARLGTSLGLCTADDRVQPDELVARFRMDEVPRTPWQLAAADL
jgi:hypothetical protein